LVLSTLHTNDCPSSLARLLDMGVEHYLLASALNGIVAQRLARTVCPNCRTSYYPSPAALEQAGWTQNRPRAFQRGEGCRHCHDSGVRGRKGIYEVMEIDDGLRALIHARAAEGDIRDYLEEHGDYLDLRSEGLRLVEAGDSTLEEVLRVTHMETRGEIRAEQAKRQERASARETANVTM
jgi:type II secretory ATPase GspE/PulE/Tfp pilus assembly ATPase PilB-like protein